MEGSMNVDLVQSIKNHFVMLPKGRMYLMPEISSEYKAWVVRWDGRIGVAVPYAGKEQVYARFSEIEIESSVINGESVLFLFIHEENNSRQWHSLTFANICENFVNPGENGVNRKMVVEYTQEWCAQWKELLGNTSCDVPVHYVVAELIVYRWLLQQGLDPKWTASTHNRLDFVTENGAWEVKSTLSHTDLQIAVNGYMQLSNQLGHPLNLMFCRMEASPQGVSINDMIQHLVSLGVDVDILEKALGGLGLKKGVFDRKLRFCLIEMRRYPIDEKFPRLTEESFVGGKLPNGIIKVNYVVDLANLEYETVVQDL